MDNAAGKQLHDLLLASKPEQARHDADLCSFCGEQASRATASGPPDVSDESTEGGATPTMSETITMETHEALVQQKVATAIAQSDQALATATEKASNAEVQVTRLETELASVKEENSKLSSDLDAAQVQVKNLEEERDQLKKDAANAATEKEQADKASSRTEQVKNLKLFPDAHIKESAARWAELSDEAWEDQIKDWTLLKPAGDGAGTGDGKGGDQASAMTGGDGGSSPSSTDSAADSGAGDQKPSARRRVLGLA